jgi:hypothetical protein
LATGHFSKKWIASAAPPGNADSEYVIDLALKCPQLECIEGQTDIQYISALYYIDYYIDSINRFLQMFKINISSKLFNILRKMLFKNENKMR